MRFDVVLLPTAIVDTEEAQQWYDKQEPGLGGEFLDALEEFRRRIALSPYIYEEIRPDTRIGLLRRFPYIVMYRIRDRVIQVVAVVHANRDPATWEDRA